MYVVVGVVFGILAILLSIIAYLFYRGYGKIKGKALSGEWRCKMAQFGMHSCLYFASLGQILTFFSISLLRDARLHL